MSWSEGLALAGILIAVTLFPAIPLALGWFGAMAVDKWQERKRRNF